MNQSRRESSVADRRQSTRSPGQIKKYQNLRGQRRTTVQHDIADCAGSRREERLMPFVQARDQCRHEESSRRPAQRPSRSPWQAQRSTPGAKQEKTQGKVTHKMAELPDVVVPHLETGPIETDQEVQYGVENPACVLGGKPVGGFDRDQRHPQQRSNPGFKQLFLIRGQERDSLGGWKNMDAFKMRTYSTA